MVRSVGPFIDRVLHRADPASSKFNCRGGLRSRGAFLSRLWHVHNRVLVKLKHRYNQRGHPLHSGHEYARRVQHGLHRSITVSNTVQVRARAFVSGQLPGDIQSKDYLYLDPRTPDVTGFSSPLPIVVFHNNGKGDVPTAIRANSP